MERRENGADTGRIPLTDEQRGEVYHRVNNRLAVIQAGAELTLRYSDNEGDRFRARAILTAVERMGRDFEELFGPASSGDSEGADRNFQTSPL